MAILDHFEHLEEPEFPRTVDPEAARRQLNVSLGLAAALMFAGAALALGLHSHPALLAQSRAPAKLVVEMPQLVHVQQAAAHARQLPGG